MKAVTLVKTGKPESAFEIREHPKPIPAKGQVRIRVEAFGLNFADVAARLGIYRPAPPLPSIIGYDVVGVVDACGQDVSPAITGKRVTGFCRFGGYAEYVVTASTAIAEIPDHMPPGVAVALTTQYCTAWHSACEKTNLYPNDRVLIHAAAGGVGTALTQIAKLKGCTVFGTASQPEKLNRMKENGVDHAINYRSSDYETAIRNILKEHRLDAVFNAVGGKTVKKDLRLLRAAGSLICFGAADRTHKKWGFFSNLNLLRNMGLTHPLFLMMQSRTIVGINMLQVADHRPDIISRCLKEVVRLTAEGKLKPHVGGVFNVEEMAKAHVLLENRQSMGKIAITWN